MLELNYRYITSILPDTERRNKDIRDEWLYLLVTSLEKGYANFKLDSEDYNFLASHTSQVLSLENLLNTLTSPTTAIYITDGTWIDETFISLDDEDFIPEDSYIYTDAETPDTTYLYTTDEFDNDQIDFVINVASADSALEDSIKYYTNLYLPAGKNYEINII